MNSLEELLSLNKFLEKEIKDVNMNDISQVISFLKKYIDCQNKTIIAFKENYDRKTIELSKYEQAIEILKEYRHILKYNGIDGAMELGWLKNEQYELLKEVLGDE